MEGVEALTFDTEVGAVCRRPSRAALSPADIPPVGSAKQGQQQGAQRGTVSRAHYRQGLGECCRLGRLSPLSKEASRPRGRHFGIPQI